MLHYENLELSNIVYFCEFDLIEKIEQWKDVVGYENSYQVSDLGRVKGITRVILYKNGRKYIKSSGIKKLSVADNGYLHTMLRKNNKNVYEPIHKLVAMAFLNHVPCGYKSVIDHKDNNPLNNYPNNLFITSQRINASKDKKSIRSKYTGVKVNTRNSSKCEAHIYIIDKKIHLGVFDCQKKASDIYQLAVKNIEKYNGVPKDFRELIKGLMD